MKRFTITCVGCGVAVPNSARQRRRCADCRKVGKAKRTVRAWRVGDPIPDGEPVRYVDPRGYVRLRWLIGTREYVEAYEHRLLAATRRDEHVHHRNHATSDNSPANLAPMSPGEHSRKHHTRYDVQQIIALYAQGLSTKAIGRQIKADPATVWRALRRAGVPTRSELRIAIPKRERKRG
jgi:hypothetical protein